MCGGFSLKILTESGKEVSLYQYGMDWIIYGLLMYLLGASSDVVGGGTTLQAGRLGTGEGLDSRWCRWNFSLN